MGGSSLRFISVLDQDLRVVTDLAGTAPVSDDVVRLQPMRRAKDILFIPTICSSMTRAALRRAVQFEPNLSTEVRAHLAAADARWERIGEKPVIGPLDRRVDRNPKPPGMTLFGHLTETRLIPRALIFTAAKQFDRPEIGLIGKVFFQHIGK